MAGWAEKEENGEDRYKELRYGNADVYPLDMTGVC